MKKSVLIILCFMLALSSAYAQFDFESIMKGSLKDANTLVEGYISPVMNGVGTSLNQGWYNTAKPHKKFGVDLTVTGNLIYVPTSEQFYTVDNTKLENVKLTSYNGSTITASGSGNVPTVFGPSISPKYQVGPASPLNPPIDGPAGVDLKNEFKIANAFPSAVYNLGIGLPKKIDLKFRFLPTINSIPDTKVSFLGVGIMHEVGQYLPGVKALPVDISLFAGYTKLKVDVTLDRPDQIAVTEFNATTIQALVSKKISVLTVYGSVGYNLVTSALDVKGSFDLDNNGSYETKDPVVLDFSTSGVRATAGLRLKLAVFTFHGDYTLSKFNMLSAGFGINVR